MTKSLLKRIFAIAGTMSLVNSALVRAILMRGGSFFTNDKDILSLLSVPNRVLYMMGSVLLHPIIMALEGSILATRDLRFLVGAYSLTMSLMLSLLEFGTSSFTGVWRALFSFQLIRCIIFGLRMIYKTRENKIREWWKCTKGRKNGCNVRHHRKQFYFLLTEHEICSFHEKEFIASLRFKDCNKV